MPQLFPARQAHGSENDAPSGVRSILTPASSLGADDAVRSFDIPADHAEKSLRVFSAQSGVQVIFPSDAVKDVTTKAVKGDMLPGVALDQLLSGTRLVV